MFNRGRLCAPYDTTCLAAAVEALRHGIFPPPGNSHPGHSFRTRARHGSGLGSSRRGQRFCHPLDRTEPSIIFEGVSVPEALSPGTFSELLFRPRWPFPVKPRVFARRKVEFVWATVAHGGFSHLHDAFINNIL